MRHVYALGYDTTSVNTFHISETSNRVRRSLQLRDLQFLTLGIAIAEVEKVESLVERVLAYIIHLKLK